MDENINIHIGKKLKTLRLYKKTTQYELAEIIGVSFQQIQKYEKGKNRISAENLYKISEYFETSLGYFFEEEPSIKQLNLEDKKTISQEMFKEDTLDLVMLFNKIKKKSVRKNILLLLKSIEKRMIEHG